MEGSVKVTVNYTGTGAVYSDHNIFICFYSEQNPSSSDYLYEGVESFSANNSSEICWLYYEEIIYLRVVYYFDGSGTYTLIGQLG